MINEKLNERYPKRRKILAVSHDLALNRGLYSKLILMINLYFNQVLMLCLKIKGKNIVNNRRFLVQQDWSNCAL